MADAIVRGARLHYQLIDGARGGVAVVFLHGLVMDNLASWYFTVANPVAQHADVLLYDLRGHGKSERPRDGYTLPEMVADLAELISICAQVRAEGRSDDGPAWAASAACLGAGVLDDARAIFREEANTVQLLAIARGAAGEPAVERALQTHLARVG